VSTIAELAEDRVVEGVYAVARKRRLRTRGGSAYLALELVDPSGRMLSRLELKVCPSSETVQLETAMTLPSRFRRTRRCA